ncbi:MAG: alpha/beta hydrolase family esterase [Polyangiales bacterium]
MHKVVSQLFALALLSCRSEAPRVDAQPAAPSSALGGAARPVRFFVRANTPSPAPLILVLHGYGGDASDVLPWSGLASLGEKGVHVVAPDGTLDSRGRRFWNANSACCDFEEKHPDDLHYLISLIDDVAARARVDAKRVYAVGLSNGGAMALRLACDAPERFAAVVSISAPNGPNETCSPKLPVSVRLVHGTADRLVPYAGGQRLALVHPRAKGVLAAVSDVAKGWALREGCGDSAGESESIDFVPMIPGDETRIAKFPGCTGGAVELATIEGGDHVPPLGPRFSDSTWSFLSAHIR